jgi:transposase
MFYYSRDRKGEHPQGHLTRYAGILQADAYDGYNQLYLAGRQPGPIREAACWSHARRPFFAMADIEENARRKAVGKKEIPLSRSRSKWCAGSMRCSRSSAPSTAGVPRNLLAN